MAEWQKKVPACFGNADHIFAGHQSEKVRALELFIELERKNVEWEDALSEFREYMQKEKWPSELVKEQEKKIKKLMKPWLE